MILGRSGWLMAEKAIDIRLRPDASKALLTCTHRNIGESAKEGQCRTFRTEQSANAGLRQTGDCNQ